MKERVRSNPKTKNIGGGRGRGTKTRGTTSVALWEEMIAVESHRGSFGKPGG